MLIISTTTTKVEKKNPLYCATRKKERKYTLRFKFSSLEL
jgi:hypothetical protein